MMLKTLQHSLIGLLIIISHYAFAIREPRATFMDSRIRVMVYSPNDVFRYTGYYGYQGSIEFEDGETIDTISMGDTVSWQIVPSGKRMFLKPTSPDATTNMTLITNKRLYFFELHAREASSINDPGLVFTVKFLYPDSGSSILQSGSKSVPQGPDLSRPEKYNFNYTLSGATSISPIKVFDDGQFTYLEFKDKNAPIPAVFDVDKKGNESIVNYQISGNYIVLEMIATKLTLRYGDAITCVFNESLL